MYFEPVDKIPVSTRRRKGLQKFIEDFVNSENKNVRIVFDSLDYESPKSCYGSLYRAVKRSEYFNVKVCIRGDDVYLTKLI